MGGPEPSGIGVYLDSLKETWQGYHMYQLINYHQGDTKTLSIG